MSILVIRLNKTNKVFNQMNTFDENMKIFADKKLVLHYRCIGRLYQLCLKIMQGVIYIINNYIMGEYNIITVLNSSISLKQLMHNFSFVAFI